MTAKQIYNDALMLCGYGDGFSYDDFSPLMKRCLLVCNCVYSELFYIYNENGFRPLLDIDEEIKLDEKTCYDCMIYGVAMLISQNQGDVESQTLFSGIYEYKRKNLSRKSEISIVNDTFLQGVDY